MRARYIVSLIFFLAIAWLAPSTLAQQPSSEEIVRALTPPPVPRGVFGPRGIEVVPSEKPTPPSIDLYINFKFDSAELEPEAMVALRSLGTALRDPRLKDAKILILGHTDAVGGDDYNMALSERRAEAVRKFLVAVYDVDTTRLQAIGRGKSELKDPSHPQDAINRRVEIRNMAEN